MYQEIIYEVADPVATVTLNRPKALNAWTTRMGAEVKHAMAAAENDPHVVAIVITGAGRGFCSGADLNDLRAISQGEARADAPPELAADPGDPSMGESFRGTYTYPLSIRKPVIAAVNGPTAGMAIPIILACDLRFASEQASFTTAFSRRGLIAEWDARAGSGGAGGDPAHGRELRPTRLCRGRALVPREAAAALRAPGTGDLV